MTSIGWEVVAEEPRHGRPGQAVGFLLELVDGREVALEVLQAVELVERGRQLAALPVEDRRQPLGLGGRLGDAVDDERLGDRLDAVDNVVEPDTSSWMSSRSNGVTKASSSRRLISSSISSPRFSRAWMLGDALVEPVELSDHLVEGGRGRGEVVAVVDEQLEELRVLRQDAEAHGDPSRSVAAGRGGVGGRGRR